MSADNTSQNSSDSAPLGARASHAVWQLIRQWFRKSRATLHLLFFYSLIPPSVLIVAFVLFDPYQLIRPIFGFRRLLMNIAYGIPSLAVSWFIAWAALIGVIVLITATIIVLNRRGTKANILIGTLLGGILGYLISLSLSALGIFWPLLPMGEFVPLAYCGAFALAGAVVTYVSIEH